MEEVEKYTLLWDLPQGYGNNWGHPYWKEIADTVIYLMEKRGLEFRSRVLDVGGGRGAFREELRRNGHQLVADSGYVSLDIAPNSGADMIIDISNPDAFEPFDAKSFDFCMSIDTLEHIPTERISTTLRNMSNLAPNMVSLISIRPDRGGKKIGTTLHMTVRPPDWWEEVISVWYWNVIIHRIVEGEYCIVEAF